MPALQEDNHTTEGAAGRLQAGVLAEGVGGQGASQGRSQGARSLLHACPVPPGLSYFENPPLPAHLGRLARRGEGRHIHCDLCACCDHRLLSTKAQRGSVPPLEPHSQEAKRAD